MDSYRQLVNNIVALVRKNFKIMHLINATVTAVNGDSCTVSYGTDEEAVTLENVRLKATIGNDDNYLLLVPKPESMVICGSMTGDYDDLAVVKVNEIDSIKIVQNGLNILIDGNDGKVSVSNNSANLLDIFNQLVTILEQLKVYTPSGVSGTPIPDSIARIQQFETSFKSLLK